MNGLFVLKASEVLRINVFSGLMPSVCTRVCCGLKEAVAFIVEGLSKA